MATLELTGLVACNVVFLSTVYYLFATREMDRFVKYFLIGEYLIAMVPLSIIGVLSENTTLPPILLIFVIHISLLFLLGVIPNYFPRKS